MPVEEEDSTFADVLVSPAFVSDLGGLNIKMGISEVGTGLGTFKI